MDYYVLFNPQATLGTLLVDNMPFFKAIELDQ